jgi:hypothetical protein
MSLVVIRVINSRKSSRMRSAGNVARMGETRNACKILVEKPERKRRLERPRRRWEGIGRMDLRVGKVRSGFIWLRIGTSEHGNGPSRSAKGGTFLD